MRAARAIAPRAASAIVLAIMAFTVVADAGAQDADGDHATRRFVVADQEPSYAQETHVGRYEK